jgi:hypothetical protein
MKARMVLTPWGMKPPVIGALLNLAAAGQTAKWKLDGDPDAAEVVEAISALDAAITGALARMDEREGEVAP